MREASLLTGTTKDGAFVAGRSGKSAGPRGWRQQPLFLPRILKKFETNTHTYWHQRRTDVEYLLKDIATMLALPYYKIYYAHYSGQVPEPRKVGKTRIYDEADIQRLRQHFAKKQQRRTGNN
jgi:hypothetical protein